MKIKRDSNKMKLVVILGIIILPLIYSLFYLKGVWDPYNSLDNLPVALVNLDECDEDCKSQQLIDELVEKNVFKFDVVDLEKADNGLINKDYYAVIKIPKDFTSSLESAATNERQQTTITYTPNTKTSYLASQIIGSAVKEVESTLQSQVSKEVVSTLTHNLQSVPGQTSQIGDAFGTIYNGTVTLNNGSNSLKNGVNTLNNNYKMFDDGISKLHQGSNTLYTSYQTLNNGINEAYKGSKTLKEKTDSLEPLISGVNELKNGSNNLNKAIASYKGKSDEMINNTTLAYQSIISYVNSNSDVLSGIQSNPNSDIAAAYGIALAYTKSDQTGYSGLEQLLFANSSLYDGSNKLNMGINTLSNNSNSLTQLKAGIDSLEGALCKINNGSEEMLSGVNELNNGLNSLDSNSKKIEIGLTAANDGARDLSNGVSSLNSGVKEAQNTVSNKISDTEASLEELNGLDEYTSDPVAVEEKDYGNVKAYGTFFSPYFMSLSLWVGGVLILMGLYYDPDHRFKVLGRNSNSRGKRLVFYNIIGIIQAIILAFVLKLTLGFEVTNYFLYYGSCILISEAFLAIIMFLFFNFQDVGKFLALVFLVLQLACCGGTFPPETQPAVYETIYPFMPMTYSVGLLRESFVSIDNVLLNKDIIVLIMIWLIFNVLIFITGILKNKRLKKLEVQ